MHINTERFLFGAGGHAKVVFDALKGSIDDNEALHVVDDDPSLVGNNFCGVQVKDMDAFEHLSNFFFHVAIGHNQARRNLFSRLRKRGGIPLTIVHPSANSSSNSLVGAGSFLAAGSIVAPDSNIGEGVIVNHSAVVDQDCQIGAFSHIAPQATLGGNVCIEEGVLVGAAAVVLPGVFVGQGCIIGAGSVVVSDIPAFSTVVGVPGRIVQKEK